jgi:hypothetical protein
LFLYGISEVLEMPASLQASRQVGPVRSAAAAAA